MLYKVLIKSSSSDVLLNAETTVTLNHLIRYYNCNFNDNGTDIYKFKKYQKMQNELLEWFNNNKKYFHTPEYTPMNIQVITNGHSDFMKHLL